MLSEKISSRYLLTTPLLLSRRMAVAVLNSLVLIIQIRKLKQKLHDSNPWAGVNRSLSE